MDLGDHCFTCCPPAFSPLCYGVAVPRSLPIILEVGARSSTPSIAAIRSGTASSDLQGAAISVSKLPIGTVLLDGVGALGLPMAHLLAVGALDTSHCVGS